MAFLSVGFFVSGQCFVQRLACKRRACRAEDPGPPVNPFYESVVHGDLYGLHSYSITQLGHYPNRYRFH